MQDKSIKVIHPDKRPMPLSDSLLNFLASHKTSGSKFKLGQWLDGVSDEFLLMLQKQTSDCLNQVSDQTYDDAMMVCLKAAEAETGRRRWNIEQLTEIVAALMLASTVERLKRREMIYIRSTLTIAPGTEFLSGVGASAACPG